MHALIFWGFVVLMIQVVTLFGRAFDASLGHPRVRGATSRSGRRSSSRATCSR